VLFDVAAMLGLAAGNVKRAPVDELVAPSSAARPPNDAGASARWSTC
jgi:hypothetical protein